MGATLTNLIPDLYANLDVVSRELTGFIPAVTLDADASRAAVNQSVRSFVAPAAGAENMTAAATVPDDGDQTIGDVEIKITKARRVPIRWSGEEERGSGPSVQAIRNAQIQQAIRTLTNEIESDLAATYAAASRAAGSRGTTPFATAGDYTAASLTRKILMDNGAPPSDLQLVIDTAAGANLRGKQASASQEFSDSLLRQGVILDINGFAIRESAQIKSPTAGTMSAGSTTGAHAVGATTITLKNATGTGSLVAGDVITIADDTNQYVVTSVDQAGANPATGDTFTIAAPGLRKALAADKVVTVIASGPRNMGFHRGAIVLAQRLGALPTGGDLAADRTTITDPRTGLSFEVAMYPGYRLMKWEISCVWGVKVVKPEHTAILLG